VIRRTVARAFGLSGDERARTEEPMPAAPNGSRIALLNQFFGELQEAFERAAREGTGGGANGGAGEAAVGAAAVRVSKTRPRPEGLEFLVDGHRGPFRFLNTLDGIIWIYHEEGGRLREDRLLSVQYQGSTPRLIEKPAGGSRSPFRFTSLPQILKEFL
jgi:hypothetical protein